MRLPSVPSIPSVGGVGVGGGPYLLRDTFTDTDGALLGSHTPEVGGPWTVQTGTISILSGRARCDAVVSSAAVATMPGGRADGRLRVVARTGTNEAGSFGVLARYVDLSNYWIIGVHNQANQFRIIEVNAGVSTIRASVTVTIADSTDYLIEVVLAGSVITATLDGANPITRTSATLGQTSTTHGLRLSVVGQQLDNLEMPR